jgi:hypothetical protein
VRPVLKVSLVYLVFQVVQVSRAAKESLEMVVSLVQEVREEPWVLQAEMENVEELVVMENAEEAVPQEPKVNKDIQECQDYLVPRVILACRDSQVKQVPMDPLENLEKMDRKVHQDPREIWDLVAFWGQEVSQVQQVNQVFLA